jgi:hypothetical protein
MLHYSKFKVEEICITYLSDLQLIKKLKLTSVKYWDALSWFDTYKEIEYSEMKHVWAFDGNSNTTLMVYKNFLCQHLKAVCMFHVSISNWKLHQHFQTFILVITGQTALWKWWNNKRTFSRFKLYFTVTIFTICSSKCKDMNTEAGEIWFLKFVTTKHLEKTCTGVAIVENGNQATNNKSVSICCNF